MEDEQIEPMLDKEQPEEAGRGTDDSLGHLTTGEVVIPVEFMQDAQTLEMLQALFQRNGANIAEFTVGDPANKINPETGYPEFFKLKKLLKTAAPIALSYFAPGLGTAIGGALGAGATFAPIVGGAALGAATSKLQGGNLLQGAALGGLGSAFNSAVAGKLNDTALGRGVSDLYKGSALQDIYTGASGALDKVSSGVSDIYKGSDLQNAFKSGGDALKSIGIDTASSASAPAPSLGGGASSYSGTNTNFLGDNFSLGGADIGSNDVNGFLKTGANTYSAPAIAGATEVAKSTDYASPLLSALLGTRANDKAEKALLSGQQANQALLAPYSNGFSFTPGDLTQDPGYQFNLSEGTKAADRAQLARGGYFSGGAAKELAQFNQGLADNTYNSAFTRALQGRNAGLTGALANAGINTDIGNIKANSATNTGNLYSGALGSLLGGNSFTNTGALQGGFDIQEFLRKNGIGNSAYAS